ncbi:hypothetical protein D3C73_618280 [compost metagenome]
MQFLAFVIRVFSDFGIGVGVAANHAPAVAELAAQIHFQATGAHFTGGAVDRHRTFGIGDQHIAFLDVEQGDVARHTPRQIKLGADFQRLGFFRRDTAVEHDGAAAQWRDGRVGFERFGVAAVERQFVGIAVDEAGARHPFLPVAVGVGMERHALAGVLVVLLETPARHENPFVGEVDRVLQKHRVAAQFIGLGAVGRADSGAWHFTAVNRVEVAEGGQAFLADQVFTVDLAVLVIDTEHQVVAHARHVDVTFKAQRGETVGTDRVLRAVHAAGQRAFFGVDGGYTDLAGVVGFAVPAVAEVGFPVVVELVIGLEVIQVRPPFHVVERLVEPTITGDVQRVVVARIDDRATVERGQEFTVFVGEQQLGAFAEPGQRRGDQGFAMHAVVAPVIFVFVVQHHAIGQAGIAQRTGAVEGGAAAILAIAIGRAARRQRVVLLKLRLLADHVHHTARILNPVEQRGRPLEHFDPVHRGVHATALHDRHAVTHNRAVAVVAKAASHHRILSATQRIALSDAADVGQGVIEIARRLIANDLRRDHVDGLRNFLKRRGAAHHRTGGRWLVAGGFVHHGSDGGRAQVQRAFGGQRLQHHRVAVGTAEGETGTAEQTLQCLLCTQLATDGGCGDAIRRFIGVDHADAGGAAEVAQGLGQRFGGHRKAELRLLLRAGLRGHRHAQRQHRQRRKTQRRNTQPLFDRTRFCPGLHDS